MADFEKDHPGIAAQELWKLFLCKVEEQNLGSEFISAVGEVCAIGLNLSKYIVRFFPTYTLHDETHSANVCRWMWVLLGKEGRKMLTTHEAALLLMAACCHDIGMSVSEEQESEMRSRNYHGWDTYFRENLADDAEYCRTGEISDRMLRNFVRMHHHERIGENLRESDWPDALLMEELDREVLLKLCRSHGTELTDADLNYREGLYDLRMCAVLLRLADLLDFDAGRTPDVLFRQMGLECPKDAESWRSAEEHQKNRAGKFRESFVNGRIPYVAVYDNPGVEQEIRKYLDWVDLELTNSRNCLSQSASHWKSLDLPYKVDDEKVQRKGYAAGKFCMTMDQDKVLDLLTGENLYSDAGVFVRELLQNSIDAVLMRARQDPDFSLEQGLIQIDTWMDEEANTWFRIRDNGTGMNEHIIQNHFLKVGNSYYTSEAFQYANRHAPKGSYTAISRFGIGILSCFMGDKEHTQLKVSTKRFGEGTKNGIRLDVTGLHGYYFLCKEKKHPESEPWFPKMPSQDNEDQGYRTEPGTTICVNTNLLRMGELRSFREILDKYVQFPEVRVEYQGLGGDHVYPTQQELMDAVYALNPDGVVKEYVHEIPEEDFEKIKKTFCYHIWNSRPKVIFCYEPLDWLSDSEMMKGVRIRATVELPEVSLGEEANVTWAREFADTEITASVSDFSIDGLEMKTELKCPNNSYKSYDMLREMHSGVRIKFSVSKMVHWLSERERSLWKQLFKVLRNTGAKNTIVTYNGVLASAKTEDSWYMRITLDFWYPKSCEVVLMRDAFHPQVNMARNLITGLPLESSCCAAMNAIQTNSPKDILYLATARQLWDILDKHPQWQKELEETTKIAAFYISPAGVLWLACWQRKCRVFLDGQVLKADLGVPSDGTIEEFPVGMFVSMQGNVFAQRRMLGHPIYNRAHPFAQWLIENREELAEQAPAIYDRLIKTMMLSNAQEKITETLNSILNLLRTIYGNHFRIPTDLVLSQADFGDV